MRYLVILCIFLFPFTTSGQNRYIISFHDKGTEVNDYKNAGQVIGQKSWERRLHSGIPFDYYDLPVAPSYKELLLKNGVRIIRSSKWLNAVLVETELNPTDIQQLSSKIADVRPAGKLTTGADKFRLEKTGGQEPSLQNKGTVINYGQATTQNKLLGIDCLHDRGFTGKGITIAFLDCGFTGLDTISYFDSLITNNRVKGTWDFWGNTPQTFYKANHGTSCASIVLANKQGNYVGMAPGANAIFAITDDLVTETPQDEFNYAAALEWADSLGADVISASISYKDFDDPQYDHPYSVMDGRTTFVTRACQVAAAKGLLIVNGAGNSGYICAPCDADSILCVGGTNSIRAYDQISSYGPSYDRRVKPDVGAMTLGVYAVNQAGNREFLSYGGTSSATPQIAGLAVCLKQSHPQATNIQVIQAIRRSAHRYANPDSLTGYGVPDACKADSILSATLDVAQPELSPASFRIFPNPASDIMYLEATRPMSKINIMSVVGRKLRSGKASGIAAAVDVRDLSPGIYLVQTIYADGTSKAIRFIKK